MRLFFALLILLGSLAGMIWATACAESTFSAMASST